VIVIHALLLVAVHAHVLPAMTLTEPVAPFGDANALLGLSELVHARLPAAWLTVNVCPPMVIVPLRAAPEFIPTKYVALAFPRPFAPYVILIHELSLTAVHGHLLLALTSIEPEPPPEVTFALVGLSEVTHVAATAA